MADTFTFDSSLTTQKDEARARLGDTGAIMDEVGASKWFLADQTIEALLSRYGFSEGVAVLAEMLIASYAHQPDSYTDDAGTQIRWTERIDALKYLAKSLRSESTKETGSDGGAYHVGQLAGPDTSGLSL